MNREQEKVRHALAGDAEAVRWLIALLSPVIQARVTRGLLRRASGGRSTRQEVEDMTQEVFVALFENGGKVLRTWEPERGMSLTNFVGLVAERQVAAILRSGRRSPWTEDPTLCEELERPSDHATGPEARVASQQLLDVLLDRLRATLSPRGLDLWERLYLREQSVEAVCAATGMSHDALYAWRSRLGKLVRAFLVEEVPDVSEVRPLRKRGIRG
jgi:DNA-directed RNA polymerase specialized sigma24 family protein